MGHAKVKNKQQNSAHLPLETAEVHVEASAETFLIVKLCRKTGRRLCCQTKGKNKIQAFFELTPNCQALLASLFLPLQAPHYERVAPMQPSLCAYPQSSTKGVCILQAITPALLLSQEQKIAAIHKITKRTLGYIGQMSTCETGSATECKMTLTTWSATMGLAEAAASAYSRKGLCLLCSQIPCRLLAGLSPKPTQLFLDSNA